MSALVVQHEQYGWYCAECCAGSNFWASTEESAEMQAARHDAENHA